MKIHGKTLSEIFALLPWPYKIVVVAASAFLLFIILYLPFRAVMGAKSPPPPAPIEIVAEQRTVFGVFDPSLVSDPNSRMVWIAYTSQEAMDDNPDASMMHVRLARASAACENWVQIAGGIDARPDDIIAPDGQSVFRTGTWRVETPSLVYDPADKGREWKLFAYKYFWPDDPAHALQVAQRYGMIVYRTASDPAGAWSNEQWLFSPAADYPPPPYEQMILLHLDRLSPALKDVVTYSRPSVIAHDGQLFMTLSAFTGGNTPDRVILVASRDHGNSWRYIGAPLKRSDAPLLGDYTHLSGASLVKQGERVLMTAALGDAEMLGRGTVVLEFDDINTGKLVSDTRGVPTVVQKLPLNAEMHGPVGGGIAGYTDSCAQGLFVSEQTGEGFRIYKTYKKPAGK